MDDALTRLQAQLELEEGKRNFIYDDATGLAFKKGDTLKGNLSVGIGLNLMLPFAPEELDFMERFRITQGLKLLNHVPWFQTQDPVRQVALADIAYNIGVGGLLHWPHFLAAMANKDYPAAVAQIRSNQLWISQVHAARAGRLESMIETGQWPADVKLPGAPA